MVDEVVEAEAEAKAFNEFEFEVLEVTNYSKTERRDIFQSLGIGASTDLRAYAGKCEADRNLIF